MVRGGGGGGGGVKNFMQGLLRSLCDKNRHTIIYKRASGIHMGKYHQLKLDQNVLCICTYVSVSGSSHIFIWIL